MTAGSLQPDLRDRYLRHLGIHPLGPPSADGLRELHRAHLDRVPFENIEIQLGRPTTIDPAESTRRFVTGRGGYCFHLNGAFAALLTSLGYDVALASGAVPDASDPEARWNHLVLLVTIDGTTWVTDVGFGSGFRDPFPLRAGIIDQLPFRYRLTHRSGTRWRFDQSEPAAAVGYDLDVAPVTLDSFVPMHTKLSTDPGSGFVQKFVVQARRADHALTLRGCVLTRTDRTGRESKDVDTADEWFDLITAEFGLDLADVDDDERQRLWRKVRTVHEEWLRTGRP